MSYKQNFRDVGNPDLFLSNFSVAYWQDTSLFVGTRYFPVVPVNLAAGKYLTYPKGYFGRPVNSKRAEDGVANTIGYKTKSEGYTVDDDAIRIFISDKKRANVANGQQLDMEATGVVTDALLINKEIDFVSKFLVPGKWATDYQGVASGPTGNQFLKWSNANSDPIGDILSRRVAFSLATGGRRWNKALMTLDVYDALTRNPSVIDRINGASTSQNPGIVTQQALAALLEVNEIEIMQSVVNMAADGLEDTDGNPLTDMQFAAEGVLMLNYVEPTVGNMKPIAAVTFAWNEFVGLGIDNGPAIRTYPGVEGRRGNFVEAEFAIDTQMVAPDMGILFYDAV
ncbi:major head protein [Klebsiella phage Kpn BU9]|nr:major head protein [Klebsiella phage Kpn BU9]